MELVRAENVGICDEDVYNSEHPLTSYTLAAATYAASPKL